MRRTLVEAKTNLKCIEMKFTDLDKRSSVLPRRIQTEKLSGILDGKINDELQVKRWEISRRLTQDALTIYQRCTTIFFLKSESTR